jgi:2-keto-3-deoxy-L-rhamnonate aldolase RhmA
MPLFRLSRVAAIFSMLMPQTQTLLERLKTAPPALGSWCSFGSFACTEMMARLGFDFLVLDTQHSELTMAHFPGLLGAFGATPTLAVVRAAKNDYHMINWLFDQGVDGVMVPMIETADDARRAVEAAKYPPLGRRSFGPYRAARYGMIVEEYMPRADRSSTLIVQLESHIAVRNVEAILAVRGVDAVFIGPNDLALSMLKENETLVRPAQGDDAGDVSKRWTNFARTPEVLAHCETVLRAAQAAGIPFGMTSGSMNESLEWFEKGASFMTVGNDFQFVQVGARQMREPL